MSLDPVGGDILNPQTLNRYAYVINNPATLTDPSGAVLPFTYQQLMQESWGIQAGSIQFGSNWNEFDMLNIALGNTDYPGCPYGDCSPSQLAQIASTVMGVLDWTMLSNFPLMPPTMQLSPREQKCLNKVQAAAQHAVGHPVSYIGQTPGTQNSNAYNFDFFVFGYTGGGAFNICGRYLPPGVFGTFAGIGPSLHIVQQAGFCNPLGDPTDTGVVPGGFEITAHIDSGFGFNPIGFIWHMFVDVIFKSKHGC